MIELKQVYKSFGTLQVLKGLDLCIPKGKITVILGPSGIGKSVTLKLIIGLLKPDRGRVMVDGTDISQLTPRELNRFRRRFGMLFQSAALFDSMSVADNIAFPLREHTDKTEAEIESRVQETLAQVGLPHVGEKFPSELSGGMRKRVGLARAITLEPQIILYDEPTTGLDPVMCNSINDLIVTMQQRLHTTSVIISHDIESTFKVADQVAMLDDGRIVEVGPPASFRKSQQQAVRDFLGAVA